jgi:hypothetical protein
MVDLTNRFEVVRTEAGTILHAAKAAIKAAAQDIAAVLGDLSDPTVTAALQHLEQALQALARHPQADNNVADAEKSPTISPAGTSGESVKTPEGE